jgi:hypothetical protein
VSRGQVWELDDASDQAAGTVVAFVSGLHVMVLDGDSVRRHDLPKATTGSNGARSITLPSGLAAELSPAGRNIQLRFSSGEAVTVRERTARAE